MMIDDKAKECPICEYQFSQNAQWLKWGAVALALLLLYIFMR